MNNLFVPYEIALKLKELGFNEPCIKYSNIIKIGDNEEETQFGYTCNIKNGINFNEPNYQSPGDGAGSYVKCYNYTSIPLYQQVIDWFREKHKISISEQPGLENHIIYGVYKLKEVEKFGEIWHLSHFCKTKDFAIEEAIKLVNV
jgi:hypothetical protein